MLRHLLFFAATCLRSAPRRRPARLAAVVLLAACAAAGCKPSRQVSVPQLLTPLAEVDTAQLVAEVNRVAAVRSLRGKVDIQFLDTSFAKCGVVEKYSTADGEVVLQRPGQIRFVIQIPFIGQDVAQMTSDGRRFAVAVLRGDEKYRRFVRGSNEGEYGRVEGGAAEPDCGGGGREREMNVRTVSALSGLRPQHLTDALLIPPIAEQGSDLIYARSESFEEEPDPRPGAKRGARVVRPYYVLAEVAPEGPNRGRLTRRFWFDRVGQVRLARIQTYDNAGRLVTDVLYKNQQNFGEQAARSLPATVEITRPQDRYSLRISYQAPDSVRVDQPYPETAFDLKNDWNLPETDLDQRNAQRP